MMISRWSPNIEQDPSSLHDDEVGRSDYVFRSGRYIEGMELPPWSDMTVEKRRRALRSAGFRARNNLRGDVGF